MNQCGRDLILITQSTVEQPSAVQMELLHHLTSLSFINLKEQRYKLKISQLSFWTLKTAPPITDPPPRQSVNTLPLNHEATYWSTQMKSVSFFPDHKLIKNPLCWHQTVWHKLKLIHNWVCIDFYPAFAGYIRAWLVSFCSGVWSKCNPCSWLAVHRALQKLAQIITGSEGQFWFFLLINVQPLKDAFRVTFFHWHKLFPVIFWF